MMRQMASRSLAAFFFDVARKQEKKDVSLAPMVIRPLDLNSDQILRELHVCFTVEHPPIGCFARPRIQNVAYRRIVSTGGSLASAFNVESVGTLPSTFDKWKRWPLPGGPFPLGKTGSIFIF